MALFIVDLSKRFNPNGQTWGNRYICDADDMNTAISAVGVILPHEIGIHGTAVTIYRARVATVAANDGIYDTTPLNEDGTFGPPSQPIVPIQTVMRVDVKVSGHGRPSRKFYHLCWGNETTDDTQVWDATFTAAVQTEINDLIADMITNGTPLVDLDGDSWLAAVAQQDFHYHQFHKRSKHNPV